VLPANHDEKREPYGPGSQLYRPQHRARVRRGTAVDDQTGEGKKTPSTARPRRRGQPLTIDDPLFRTIGIGDSGVPDVSANKHHYLAEA
jgi:hypothetical protein